MFKSLRSLSLQVGSLVFLCLLFVPIAHAQSSAPRLDISSSSVTEAPTVELTVSAIGVDGRPLDLSQQFISIKHNGVRVDDASAVGSRAVGTFTVFLLDLTEGVEPLLPEINAAIEQFAAVPTMEETVDFVAIYRVDEVASVEMLAPASFHNEVRNLLTEGIETPSGPTALVNSLGNLIARMSGLRPVPHMASSIVIFSDGTDAVSTEYEADEIAELAASQNIALYTVWLDNPQLSFSADSGREYLRSLAEDTNAIATTLDDRGQIEEAWRRIAELRDHTIVHYVVDDMTSGTFPVELTLPDLPAFPVATTQVSIPATIPSIQLEIPVEARTLTLPSVEEPVRLAFPTTVRWLDGQTRTVVTADFYANDARIAEVAPSELAMFMLDVPLEFGDNSFQVIIRDDTGQEARSAPVVITVAEGDRAIPDPLDPGMSVVNQVLIGVAGIFLLGVLGVIFRFGIRRIRSSDMRLGNLLRRGEVEDQYDASVAAAPNQNPGAGGRGREQLTGEAPTVASAAARPAPVNTTTSANIEVLEALSNVPRINAINRTEFLIGRSPTVDLAFTNDPTVSRIHATIVKDGDAYRIYDEQSTSGTYVNDREVPEYGLQLADRDEIHLGAVHLRFRQDR